MWRARTSAITAGSSIERTPAAIITGTFRLYLPTNCVMITVSGWVSALLAKIRGIVNSPQVLSSRIAVSAAMPPRIWGSTTLRNAWKREQPSTRAASSSSTGMSRT